jgi:hypothetical protein
MFAADVPSYLIDINDVEGKRWVEVISRDRDEPDADRVALRSQPRDSA